MIQSKVAMGGIGGCVSIILLWALKQYLEIDPPPDVVQAFTTLCCFGAGWATKSQAAPIELTEQVK